MLIPQSFTCGAVASDEGAVGNESTLVISATNRATAVLGVLAVGSHCTPAQLPREGAQATSSKAQARGTSYISLALPNLRAIRN